MWNVLFITVQPAAASLCLLPCNQWTGHVLMDFIYGMVNIHTFTFFEFYCVFI